MTTTVPFPPVDSYGEAVAEIMRSSNAALAGPCAAASSNARTWAGASPGGHVAGSDPSMRIAAGLAARTRPSGPRTRKPSTAPRSSARRASSSGRSNSKSGTAAPSSREGRLYWENTARKSFSLPNPCRKAGERLGSAPGLPRPRRTERRRTPQRRGSLGRDRGGPYAHRRATRPPPRGRSRRAGPPLRWRTARRGRDRRRSLRRATRRVQRLGL